MDGHDPETGEILPVYTGMPEPIATAIVAVMGKVKVIGQDEKNEHGGYPYVSVDKFYEVIGPLMAAQNIFLAVDEISADVREGGSGKAWLFTKYELRFVHASGAASPPMRRSCAQPISGPQAFGAAQSYIEKQFLRQVFKVPTGEKDADEVAQQDSPPARRRAEPAGRATAQEAPRGTNGSQKPVEATQRPLNGANAGPAETARDATSTEQSPTPSSSGNEALKQKARNQYAIMQDAIDNAVNDGEIAALLASNDWDDLHKMIGEAEGAEKAINIMKRLSERAEKVRGGMKMEGYANA